MGVLKVVRIWKFEQGDYANPLVEKVVRYKQNDNNKNIISFNVCCPKNAFFVVSRA